MIDHTPQVFISYSWTSEAYKQQIKKIAERLMHDGILVKLDIWDLKDGHDKYAYMEQCVTDPHIDRVLIFSDKKYAEKADNREGGVGDETVIISPEMYGHADQEKFIPVVMERDEHGKEYLPAYLKSRMYRDLSGDNFESEYKMLVRNIYDEPLERKPELGSRPAWLDEKPDALFPVREAVRRVENADIGRLRTVEAQDFIEVYIEAMKQFFRKDYPEDQVYLDDFKAMKEYRDVFLDYLKTFSGRDDFGSFMADAFEKLYNALCDIHTFVPNVVSWNNDQFDIFRLHIWELFVCTTTYMLHNELYSDIHELLYHSYFLHHVGGATGNEDPISYEGFRFHSKMMDERIKHNMPGGLSTKYTLAGHFIVNEREYLPVYSGRTMANADLFLYQVYNGLKLDDLTRRFAWFPTLYVYADKYDSVWKKLRSVQFCKKIMPVFGVNTMDDFKERISHCTYDRDMRYSHGFAEPAPAILTFIKPEEIGTLP